MAETPQLVGTYAEQFPHEFARALAQGASSEITAILDNLPSQVSAKVASKLPTSTLTPLIQGSSNRAIDWLASASVDDAIALVGRLPRETSLATVNALQNQQRRRRLLQFLNYPAHSVGAFVKDVPLRFPIDQALRELILEVQALRSAAEQPIVLTDANERFAGVLDVWSLAMRVGEPGALREYVLQVTPLRPEVPAANALNAVDWHSRSWLPVADHDGRLLGAVFRHHLLQALANTESSANLPQFADAAADVIRGMANLAASAFSARRQS